MKKVILVFAYIFIATIFYSCSCSTNNTPQQPTAYEMMAVTFEGQPQVSEIQPLLEAVMNKHKLPITEENKQRAASALIKAKEVYKLREMDLLNHMLSQGAEQLSFTDQLGYSIVALQQK